MKKRETHGGRSTPLYITWCGMKARCLNKNSPSYANYGGRGITVCPQWIESFAQFRADMGERPDSHTLERADNSKGYEPGNCVWATRSEQGRNRRSTLVPQRERLTPRSAMHGVRSSEPEREAA